MTSKILLIGCGGHAKSVIDIVENTLEWSIFGLIGLPEQVGHSVQGYSVVGSDKDLSDIRAHCHHAFLALGQIGISEKRQHIAASLNALGFSFPTLISSKAFVSNNAIIDVGSFVGHGAVINASASVGKHCILNSLCLVEHDSSIGDFCHISTGVLLNGGVSVGSGSFIGSGCIIREGICIPQNTSLSAGQRVMGWPLRKPIIP